MRRNRAATRPTIPDPRNQSRVVSKFMSNLMRDGKKSTAERVVYDAFDKIEEVTGRRAIDVFEAAVRNVTPVIEVKPRRVGGATYQVPVEIRGERRLSLGVRWLVQAARKRSGKSMVDKLAAEFLDASNNLGAAVKRREETHKMAEANKAFSHFRF